MPRGRRVAAALATSALLMVSACSQSVDVPPSTSTSTPGATSSSSALPPAPDRLRVAISFDQPGLGVKDGDEYSGLDVDIARYVAQQMGVEQITFVQAISDQRETLLATGQADLVISSYSMTPQRAEQVAFAGPYLVTDQELLLPRRSAIRSPQGLRGFTVCGATGSSATQRLVRDYTGLHIVEEKSVDDCVERLRDHEVKAVTSDTTVLAGYLGQGEDDLRLSGRPFGRESYGIGLPKDDSVMCYRVSEALRTMISSGEWRRAVARNLPSAKVIGRQTYRPPQVRSCTSPTTPTSAGSSTSS
ncbi:hypothetical protein AWH69_08765 [Janibacter melonis]|uniref:Solute-binding protein family 3/N-terminal domain-containing protein n=1 Tax=Janibacter melonis TaxID=262209 RepID=A0A176QEG4_9MICO|nr:transporter substrate-binding domain-containing protein [Janibacter melonis]OAB88074.1 hypothetical protein AWH69_08765 [Janibacter melonis]